MTLASACCTPVRSRFRVTEDYFFVCRRETLENPSVMRIIEVMRSREFQEAIAENPGYAVKDAGKVKSVRDTLRS